MLSVVASIYQKHFWVWILSLFFFTGLFTSFTPAKAQTGSKPAGASSQSSKPSQPDKFVLPFNHAERYQEGRSYYAKEEYAIAAAIFLTILKSHPGHLDSRLFLALSYNRLGEYNKSHRLFSQIIKLNSLAPSYFLEAGYALLQVNKFTEAFNILKAVPKTEKNYDIAMFYAGVCEYELGKYNSAATYLKRAVVLPKALAEAKTSLLAKIESASKKKPRTSKEAKPPSYPPPSAFLAENITATPSLLDPARDPSHYFYLKGWHLNYQPVYRPTQTKQSTEYTLFEPGYVAEWKLYGFKNSDSEGLLGASVNLGSRYSLEFLESSVEQQTPYLNDYTLDTVVGREGLRHDNLMFFTGVSPWFEWHRTAQLTLGVEGAYQGFFGEFQNGWSLLSQFQGTTFLDYLLSSKILLSIRLQADSWLGLKTGKSAQYGLATEIKTQFNEKFLLKVSGSAKKRITSQKSYVANTTFVGSLILDYQALTNLFVLGGSRLERYHDYQIWPRTENTPYKADGNKLGLVMGLNFEPFDHLHLSAQYVISKLLWNPINNVTSEQWEEYAPIAQDELLVMLSWKRPL